LIINGYFYAYFNESSGLPNMNPSQIVRNISVARAKVSDVISSAKNRNVTPWKKLGASG
jgi:hypothetical protein